MRDIKIKAQHIVVSNTMTCGKLVIKCPRKPREAWRSAEGVSPKDFHEAPEA